MRLLALVLMLVMPSNNSGFTCGYIAGQNPGRIGWLLSTDSWRQNPSPLIPWALDNGAYPAWEQKRPWNEAAFYERLEAMRYFHPRPLWVVVPDVVTDRIATLASWQEHAPRVAALGYRLAFAAQDGMTARDVPSEAEMVFVGGTTDWKWRNLREWTDNFPRVHVARVNTERMLWMAHKAGAESCDGTGWFRGDQEQLAGLVRYLKASAPGASRPQLELFPI